MFCPGCEREGMEFDLHGDGFQYFCKLCRRSHVQRDWMQRIIINSQGTDRSKGFKVVNPITIEWIETTVKRQEGCCFYCAFPMKFGIGINRKESDALTVERLDNSLGHDVSNCVLACHECNERARNVPQEIMNSGYAPNLKEGVMKWCPGPLHTTLEEHVLMADDFCFRERNIHNLHDICKRCDMKAHDALRVKADCRYCGQQVPKGKKFICGNEACFKRYKSEGDKAYHATIRTPNHCEVCGEPCRRTACMKDTCQKTRRNRLAREKRQKI